MVLFSHSGSSAGVELTSTWDRNSSSGAKHENNRQAPLGKRAVSLVQKGSRISQSVPR
ncbi:MAG: hypothetical protein PsegKO_29270 [Pseudohongiellaceae bacterium]